MDYCSAVKKKKKKKKEKKKKIVPFVTAWLDLEYIILSEITQLEKYKYRMIHSCVESDEQTELTSKIQTDS